VIDEPSRAIAIQLPKTLIPYARTTIRWRPGCNVTVLHAGGETYPAMLEALRGARRTICLETYILASDATGDRFKDVLVVQGKQKPDNRFDLLDVVKIVPRAQVEYDPNIPAFNPDGKAELGPYEPA